MKKDVTGAILIKLPSGPILMECNYCGQKFEDNHFCTARPWTEEAIRKIVREELERVKQEGR